jgi:hypothetical protein
VISLDSFLEITEKAQNFGLLFSLVKVDKKWVGLNTFWAIFYKLIWSPCQQINFMFPVPSKMKNYKKPVRNIGSKSVSEFRKMIFEIQF